MTVAAQIQQIYGGLQKCGLMEQKETIVSSFSPKNYSVKAMTVDERQLLIHWLQNYYADKTKKSRGKIIALCKLRGMVDTKGEADFKRIDDECVRLCGKKLNNVAIADMNKLVTQIQIITNKSLAK